MLDTHVAASLYEGRRNRLSMRARGMLDRDLAVISPAVLLELEFMHEIGRTRSGARIVARYLGEELDIRIAEDSFAQVAEGALDLIFTRDPFDRLIVAHAVVLKVPLITFDAQIQANYSRAMN
ncbi:MAG TPA: PIN domain-containing protein [Rudaea sp.]|jgi:PIN domain nuclease of toxin-antitoxin system|nr:PIN domain-containing protein [Rudaea sp.]